MLAGTGFFWLVTIIVVAVLLSRGRSSNTRICKKCHTPNPMRARYCSHCGAWLTE